MSRREVLAWVLVAAMCSAALTYRKGGEVPTGGIIAIDTGACPAGFTELTAARGRFLVGTPAAGTVGGTYGSAHANLTAPTFTGSALATHQHRMPYSLAEIPTIRTSNANLYGSGAAVTNEGRYTVSATDVADVNITPDLTEGVSAGTPAGTINIGALQVVLCKRS